MRVFITGVAGLLGSWLAEALVAKGATVVGYDNLSGGDVGNICVGTEFLHGDILNANDLYYACKGCDVVYHCAALAYEGLSVFSPALISQNILVGSVNVAVASINNGVKRLVNCSSMARYGKQTCPYMEGTTPEPNDPYGVAKVAAERTLTMLGQTHGLEVLHAVPHNIIGPRQKYDDPYRNVAAIMINRLLQDKPPIIYGDGQQRRCFSYITDVLQTLVQLIDTEMVEQGEAFNIGPDEEPITINQLAWTIRKLMDKTDQRYDPIYVNDRPREVKYAYCSSNKIRKRFGYKTQTTLEEGLQQMIAYISSRGPRPFQYVLPLEIESAKTPSTWKEQQI